MPRPILAQIDLAALRHNLAAARARAGSRRIWAVAKANAYGHGLERALRAFADADGLGVIDLNEAARARAAGWTRPILLLEGFFETTDVATCRELELTIMVHRPDQVALLQAGAPPIAAYIKLNSGMSRLGIEPAEVADVYARLQHAAGARIAGVAMHFANADRGDPASGPLSMHEQLQRFDAACGALSTLPRCISNSAALFLHAPLQEDWVRPGIALYGASPDDAHTAAQLGLRPAMHLRSRLLAVREVAAGERVGYGSRFVARQPTRIGVVACGYADGYPRCAPDGTPVIVDGVRVPLSGRVSMDLITVDLTAAPQAQVGSSVELWGAQLPIDEVARHCGTVGYELMCALAPRVPVEVIG